MYYLNREEEEWTEEKLKKYYREKLGVPDDEKPYTREEQRQKNREALKKIALVLLGFYALQMVYITFR